MYQVKLIQNNRSNEPLTPKGIVVHDTATPGATATQEYNYFNNAYRGASAHAFVDWNGVVQTVPYTEEAWHAGPTANERFIGIEMCVPSQKDEALFSKVWDSTVSLFADLFRQFNLGDVTGDNLMSHAEVSEKWKETDHTDPVSYFTQYGKSVNEFRQAVQAQLSQGGNQESGSDEMIYNYIDDNMPAWARPTIQKLVDKGYLEGNEKGELNLNDEMLRLLVINDRAGLYQ